jgi:hypothetical protein
MRGAVEGARVDVELIVRGVRVFRVGHDVTSSCVIRGS